MDAKNSGPNTRSVHAGCEPDPQYGAVATPIYQTSTFAFESTAQGAARFAGTEEGYIYSRMGNPTTRALEDAVAELEGGHAGLATASGMAAISTVFLARLEAGAHIVCSDCVYGPSRVMLEKHLRRFGVDTTFVDPSDLEQVRAAVRPETRMVYVETPENPTMRLTDIGACAEIAHAAGAELVVDNTFASPILQRPLEHGADIVVHSMTKFLNGHADVVAGMIVTSTKEQTSALRNMLNHHGGNIDPHQAWLVHRGIKTLALRVHQAQKNAIAISDYLHGHPAIDWVSYPGATDHPQHELALRQMDGPGAVMAFGVQGGIEGGIVLMESLQLATLAVSLGGVETLIEHPASMTHASLGPQARAEAGIADNLVRLAVGCEDAADLIADLEQALACVARAGVPTGV
jgi:methionine-gamma-lyase